jgi:hypothetical protein
MIEILQESSEFESGTAITQHSVWLSMVMYGELKKAVMPSFRLISQAERNHDNIKIACVLIQIRFRELPKVKYVPAETMCRLPVLYIPKESGRSK